MKRDESGKNAYKINYQSIFAMREIGKGHSALSTFCGLMSLSSPMQIKPLNEMQKNLSEAHKNS